MHEEHRPTTATVLFSDVVGSTAARSALGEDRADATRRQHDEMSSAVVADNGGRVVKFMGDGIMATFGAAAPSGRYAADALRAAEQIAVEVESWQQDAARTDEPVLAVGTAVATGRVVFGAVGDDSRLEYTVIGEAVNLCAKLEKHTKKVRAAALCPADAHRIAVSQGYRPESAQPVLRNCTVEGLPEPIDIVVLARAPDQPR